TVPYSLPLSVLFSSLRTRPAPRPTLFPYTTLFRSRTGSAGVGSPWPPERDGGASGGVPCSPNGMAAPSRRSSIVHTPFPANIARSEEHTSELQSRFDLVCRLLLEKKKKKRINEPTK